MRKEELKSAIIKLLEGEYVTDIIDLLEELLDEANSKIDQDPR